LRLAVVGNTSMWAVSIFFVLRVTRAGRAPQSRPSTCTQD
jgi:hypothetical protein